MTAVAGVLEGLILIPVPGQAGPLPPEVPAVALAIGGTHLIPLTDDVRARCHQADGDASTVEGFHELTQGIARWAQQLSRGWMVLYAHCEFFGGDGIHAAIAWYQESVIFGPSFTRTRGEPADPPYQVAVRPDMAINAGLRALGIQASGGHDEFATIGLGKHRWTNNWLTE
ncbi:MAG TPA: hypothetical protein DHU96_14415 [Actinobacteria bacterium]|nr:hypothetical protein [Actinomycetota bacterium]